MTASWDKIGFERGLAGYDIVRGVLAAILLISATLKGYQLATDPLSGLGLLHSRWFLIFVVEAEFCFALWLLSGRAPRLTWDVALLCFGTFACMSAYKGIAGDASCGCFGKVQVNPWHTFGMDIAIVGLLFLFPPRTMKTEWPCALSLPGWLLAALALGVGLPGAALMAGDRAASISADGKIRGPGSLVLLLPEEWKAKSFPLLDHIDVGRQLRCGQWIVILYHPRCPKCEELIEWLRSSPATDFDPVRAPNVAFIEVAGFGHSTNELLASHSGSVVGKLDDSREWFVSTPTVLTIKDGIVEEVCNEQSVAALRETIQRQCRLAPGETSRHG